MRESYTNIKREEHLDALEEQLSVNHCNLVSPAIFNIFIHIFLELLRFIITTFELTPLLTFLFSFFPKLPGYTGVGWRNPNKGDRTFTWYPRPDHYRLHHTRWPSRGQSSYTKGTSSKCFSGSQWGPDKPMCHANQSEKHHDRILEAREWATLVCLKTITTFFLVKRNLPKAARMVAVKNSVSIPQD